MIGLAIYITLIFFITGALTQREQNVPAILVMGTCCASVPLSAFAIGYWVYVKTIRLPD